MVRCSSQRRLSGRVNHFLRDNLNRKVRAAPVLPALAQLHSMLFGSVNTFAIAFSGTRRKTHFEKPEAAAHNSATKLHWKVRQAEQF
jgi:hypothetical protein